MLLALSLLANSQSGHPRQDARAIEGGARPRDGTSRSNVNEVAASILVGRLRRRYTPSGRRRKVQQVMSAPLLRVPQESKDEIHAEGRSRRQRERCHPRRAR